MSDTPEDLSQGTSLWGIVALILFVVGEVILFILGEMYK